MPITVHYFQSAASDSNFRTLNGANDKRLSVDTITATGNIVMPPAPPSTTFCVVETDVNLRYTVTPKSVEDAGGVTLADGTSTTPGDTSLPIAANAFAVYGPITCEGGDILRFKTY